MSPREVASRWTDPLPMGAVTLKNRIVVTAHTYGLYDGSSAGTKAMCAYVDARLRGGVAMLVMGETLVGSGDEAISEWGSALSDARILDLYKDIRLSAHTHEAIVVEQLYHPGGQVWHEEGAPALAPSAVPHTRSGVLPLGLMHHEIERILDDFVASARRASIGGLHGVEIKADQGKLIHQFLSKKYNFRTDVWGGSSIAERSTFLMQLLRRLRKELPDLLVGVRLPIIRDDRPQFSKPDLSVEDVCRLVRQIDDESLVDYVSLSAATNSFAWGYVQGHPESRTSMESYWEDVRRVGADLSIPVLAAGGVYDVESADQLIGSGYADLIGMTRAHIADPELVSKSRVDPTTVRPCIACNSGCVGNTWYGRPIRCSVNPTTGRELLVLKSRGREPGRRVAVVGAGPAGLQSALSFADAGVAVDIFEREAFLGGQMRTASRLPGRERYQELLNYFQAHLTHVNQATIHLGAEVILTADFVRGYDQVVIAVGSEPSIPEHLAGSGRCVTDVDALSSIRDWDGMRVLVADTERTRDALGTAEWLAARGAEVVVCTPFDAPGLGLDPVTLVSRLRALRERGVEVLTWTEVAFISARTIVLTDQVRDYTFEFRADLVVFVANGHPRQQRDAMSLPSDVQQRLIAVGDAIWPRGLEVAIREAYDSFQTPSTLGST